MEVENLLHFTLPTFLCAKASSSSSSSSSSSPRSLTLTTPVSLRPAFLAFFAFDDGFGELLAEFGVSVTFLVHSDLVIRVQGWDF